MLRVSSPLIANTGESGVPKWTEIFLAVSLYLVLTLIATYPAIRYLNVYPIGGGDTTQNIWNLWWVRLSMSRGNGLPFYTTMLYYPDGVSLAYHTLDLFNGWLAFPLQTWLRMGLPATFNTISLMTFVASGASMYLLLRSMTKSQTAAFVAGLIFTFSPFRMSRVVFGNLEVYSTQFIPLLVWFLARAAMTHQWRDAVGAACAMMLTAWCSLELAFGLGLLAIFLFAFDVSNTRHLMVKLKWWMLFGILAGVSVLVVALPMIHDYPDFQDQMDQYGAAVWNSADLAGFFVPDHQTAPLIERLAPQFITRAIEKMYATFYGNPHEKTVFVGYSVLAMVILSLSVTRSPIVRRWALIAVAFFVLCLGPVLHVAGQPVCPMPYTLFFHIPLVQFGRTPSRLALFLMLALAIIVGYGCASLEKQEGKWGKWATVLVGVLVFAEFLIVPVRLDSHVAEIPDYYYQLANEQQDGAILDVPVDLYGAQGPAGKYMLYQTVHHKPIVGGYISRTPSNVLRLFEEFPLLYQLRARIYDDDEPFIFSPDILAHGLEDLRALHIQYVVLHIDELSAEDSRVVGGALSALLPAPRYQDDRIVVWQLDVAATAADYSPSR